MPCLLLWGSFFFSSIVHAGVSDCSSPKYDETVRLKHVIDGDTISLQDGRKVRFIGINTPELQRDQQVGEPLAREARAYLVKLLVDGPDLYLRYGVDKKDHYGRLLAHVFTIKGRNISTALLKAGLGSSVQITPNLWSYRCYLKAEKQAQENKKGIWSHPYFKPINVEKMPSSERGFHFVKGRISRIGKSNHAVWLNMGKRFVLRIDKSDLKYFENLNIDQLLNKTVVARGWIYPVKKQQRINLHHPAALQVIPAISVKARNR